MKRVEKRDWIVVVIEVEVKVEGRGRPAGLDLGPLLFSR